MNLLNKNYLNYLAQLTLLITLLAVGANFDGTITVQIIELGLRVQVNRNFPGCIIDQQLPDEQKVSSNFTIEFLSN
ncbi:MULTISPECIES: hypothetical protein [unclassified Anabaena]|uniref:hypothetical protein n=1 Tax=unclassified Anabaena TaxID=2619674 RepID=UPI0039C6CE0D